MESIKEKTSLRVSLLDSVVDGKEKFKTKTFSNINLEATDSNIYTGATSLYSLQDKEVRAIKRVDVFDLSQD